DADVGGLAPTRREEPDARLGGAIHEPRRTTVLHPGDQPALPVQLLFPLEPVERLEHAEVGARDHRPRSLARGTVSYPLGIRRKELQPWPNRRCSPPRTGVARNPGACWPPTGASSVILPSGSSPMSSGGCCGGGCSRAGSIASASRYSARVS